MEREKVKHAYFHLIQFISLMSLFILTVMIGGCATENKSVGLGAGMGAGIGAIAGGLADPGKDGQFRTRNVIVGATLGSMAGMVTGSVLHQDVEEQKKESYLKGRAAAPSQKTGATPALKNAKVESRWIEAHSVGNRYIDGHFEYIIVEPAKWDESP